MKKTGKRPIIRQAAALALALFAILLTLPAQAVPPSHAPAYGYRDIPPPQYNYVYYPVQQVYYAPQQGVWFWLSSDRIWRTGATLPAAFRSSNRGDSIQISLVTPHPYVQHVHVEEKYGRPWREKHGYKNKPYKHKRDRDRDRDDD